MMDYVKVMQEKMKKITPIVRQNMESAQQDQRHYYNHAAQPREFKPGDSPATRPECHF